MGVAISKLLNRQTVAAGTCIDAEFAVKQNSKLNKALFSQTHRPLCSTKALAYKVKAEGPAGSESC